MKKLIILVFCVILIAACTPKDLPPSPGFPGGSAPIGEAIGAFEGYAEPTSLSLSETELVFAFSDTQKDIDATVTGEQYVYKTGYVLDIPTDTWKAFDFDEDAVALSNWISGDASKTLTIQKDSLQINVGETTTLYIIAYACTKVAGEWDCHENKWMIQDFTASSEDLPDDPTGPGTVPGGETPTPISEGIKIEKVDNKFNYEDTISSVQNDYLTGDHVTPTLLPGTYIESEGANKNDIDYTQALLFMPGNAKLIYDQDDDGAPLSGDYLFIDKSSDLYTYELSFAEDVAYSTADDASVKDDFATSSIIMAQQAHHFIDAGLVSGTLDSLSTIAATTVLWLTQNNPITKTVADVEHTIEVLDAPETITGTPIYGSDACQVKVDDVTAIIDVGETEIINGVEVGVTDATLTTCSLEFTSPLAPQTLNVGAIIPLTIDSVEHTLEVVDTTEVLTNPGEVTFDVDCQVKVDDVVAIVDVGEVASVNGISIGIIDARKINAELDNVDTCNIAIDAKHYKFTQGKEVQIDGQDVDGTSVELSGSNGFLEGIILTYAPQNLDDDVWLDSGEEFVDPLFGAWKIIYGGLTTDHNIYSIQKTGDTTAVLNYKDDQGIDVAVDIALDAGVVAFADGTTLNTEITTSSGATMTLVEENSIAAISFSELPISDETTPSVIDIVVAESTLTSGTIEIRQPIINIPNPGIYYSVEQQADSDFDNIVTLYGSDMLYDSVNKDSFVINIPSSEVYGSVFVAPVGW